MIKGTGTGSSSTSSFHSSPVFLFGFVGGGGGGGVYFTAPFVVKFPATLLISVQPEHLEMYRELICA